MIWSRVERFEPQDILNLVGRSLEYDKRYYNNANSDVVRGLLLDRVELSTHVIDIIIETTSSLAVIELESAS